MTTGRDFARGVNPNHPAAFNKAASGTGHFNPSEPRDDHGRWTSGGGGTTKGHSDDVFRHHQVKIAKATLKLSDEGAFILGGMTKDQARQVLGQGRKRR